MKITILSDIHDNIWNLDKVLKQIKPEVAVIIFCGDLVAPFTARILSGAKLPTYICLGNNDEDHIGMMRKGGRNFHWVHLSQEFGEIELDGRKIAFCHYPKLAELLAKTGDYDAVFFGHTHFPLKKKHGATLLLNPGAVCGIQEGKPGKATYALYDTKRGFSKLIDIE